MGPFYVILIIAAVVITIYIIRRYKIQQKASPEDPQPKTITEPIYAEITKDNQHPVPATFSLNVLK